MRIVKGFAIGVFITLSAFLLWGGFALMSDDPYGGGLIIGVPMATIGGGLAVVSVRLLVNHFKE